MAVATRATTAGGAERVSWLAYTVLGVGWGLIGPALLPLSHLLHVGYGAMGGLFAAGAVGTGLSFVLGNRIVDRWGYRRVIAGGLLGYGLCLGLASALPAIGVWVLALAVGMGAGGVVDVAAARLVSHVAGGRRSGALNLLNVFYGLGGLLAPLAVAAALAAHQPVVLPFAATGLALAAGGAAAWRWVPAGGDRLAPNLAVELRWALSRPWLRPLILLLGLYVGSEVSLSGWVAAFGRVAVHLPAVQAAALPFVFWAALTLGRVLAFERARRWREETLLEVGAGLALVGALGVVLSGTGPVLATATALAGLGCGPIFATSFALAARWAPDRQSASFGVLYPAGAAGDLVLPWLVGGVFGQLGPRAALSVPLLGLAVVAAMVLRVRLGRAAAPSADAGPASLPGP